MTKQYNVKTKYGETTINSESQGASTTHTYKGTKVKSKKIAKNITQLKLFLEDNFKITQYGLAYLRELDTSYALYGDRGVNTQLLYFFSNARAVTEEGKKYRQRVTKGGNPFQIE